MPTAAAEDPLWYKDAVIYELHVRAFGDTDGDGVGDFVGLTERLDYLQQLGVTAIWLLPFYPSPLRDDGYDIADYANVNPAYGTRRDFKAFLREAHRRGLRVITELVLNHTSDQHPWFQRARTAKAGSRWRDFYVWSDTYDRYTEARIIFEDYETSNWTWDPVAGAYYWHRFFSHQPDLNFDNPEVRATMLRAVDGWLEMGVDGVRLDAVPYLFEREGTNCENLPETHAFLRELRAHVDTNFPGRMLLAEANQWPEDSVAYFGDGDECHTAFHFPLMPRLFMSLRMEDRFPVIDILQQTPDIPARGPVGHLPAQPRRADPGDGHRRGARLHVPGLRRRPADAGQRGHPPPPRPAPAERPAQDRADERPALRPAGHARHLLRRRVGHGRQRLPGRPGLGAHAHAVEPRPQRRVLPRQPPAALPADHHRPRVPLRDGQRRGPAGQPQLAVVVDAPHHRPAGPAPGVRPGRHRVPAARERQGAGLHPHPRRRPGAGGGQPVALRPERPARPARGPGHGPRRAVRRDRVRAHPGGRVQPDAGALRLLLVLAATPAPRRPGAGGGRRGPAGGQRRRGLAPAVPQGHPGPAQPGERRGRASSSATGGTPVAPESCAAPSSSTRCRWRWVGASRPPSWPSSRWSTPTASPRPTSCR